MTIICRFGNGASWQKLLFLLLREKIIIMEHRGNGDVIGLR